MNIFPDYYVVYLEDDPRVLKVPMEKVNDVFYVCEQVKFDWSKNFEETFDKMYMSTKRYKLEIIDSLTCIGRRL